MGKRAIQIVVPVLLATAFLLQTSWARRTTSLTFDETFYLNCALQTVHDGWLDKRLSDSGVGALPVTIWGLPVAATYPKMNRPEEWQGSTEDPPINAWFRWWNSVLIGLPLVFVVYFWLYRRRGLAAATFAGALLVFSPSILAHGSLATTDASFALFALLAIGSLSFYLQLANWFRFGVLGVSIGLAIAAKILKRFSLPGGRLALDRKALADINRLDLATNTEGLYRRNQPCCTAWMLSLNRVVGDRLVFFHRAFEVRFSRRHSSDSPWIKVLGNGPTARWFMDVAHEKLYRPSVFGSLVSRYLHERDGHDAYLMGEYSRRGWRAYFPLAFIFKSTLAELALAVATLVLAIIAIARCRKENTDRFRLCQIVWLVAFGFFR